MSDQTKHPEDQMESRRRFLKLGAAAAGASVIPVKASMAQSMATSINCEVFIPSANQLEDLALELASQNLPGGTQSQIEDEAVRLLEEYAATTGGSQGQLVRIVDEGSGPMIQTQQSELGVEYLRKLALDGSGVGGSCLQSAMVAAGGLFPTQN